MPQMFPNYWMILYLIFFFLMFFSSSAYYKCNYFNTINYKTSECMKIDFKKLW